MYTVLIQGLTVTTYSTRNLAINNNPQIAFGFGTKAIYAFTEGIVDKMVVGGKGAGLAEMAKLGLPVPPGFTIPIKICHEFQKIGKLTEGLFNKDIMGALKNVEDEMGRKFGDETKPLLVSVRSGAPVSMLGMMDTILNVGLNDLIVQGLAKEINNERFAFDSYRRLIQMFGTIVKNIDSKIFEKNWIM